MLVNKPMRHYRLTIREWLAVALVGLIVLSGVSCWVHYGAMDDVQAHSDDLRTASRLQSINAELALNVTHAWLRVNAGGTSEQTSAVLGQLQQQLVVLKALIDEASARGKDPPGVHGLQNHVEWLRLRSSLSDIVRIVETYHSSQTSTALDQANSATMQPPVNDAAFKEFVDILRSNIATNRFWAEQTHSDGNWLLWSFCIIALSLMGATLAYTLVVLLFINYKVGTRVRDVFNRLLHYTSDDFSTPGLRPGRDEFGKIELQIDECAAKAHGRKLEILRRHQATTQELEDRSKQLTKLNRALQDSGRGLIGFLTDVSHDLRTPLAIVAGECEVSLRSATNSNSECHDTISRILEQARFLGSLVDQLLYAARCKVSALPQEAVCVDFVELTTTLSGDLKNLAKRKQVSIQFQGECKTAVVLGDRVRLREMLLIILDNAIEYSKQQGVVSITIRKEQPFVQVRVADTGIGIPASELSMVFRRFYRGHNSSGSNPNGTGVGLAIAKGIVESHGGSIEIESQEDTGTTVSLALPLAEDCQTNHDMVHAGEFDWP